MRTVLVLLSTSLLVPASAAAFEPWHDDAYGWRYSIRVTGQRLTGSVDGVVAYIPLDPRWYHYDKSLSEGRDLLFVDSTGEHLPHELVSWAPGGRSQLWVLLRELESGSSHTLWLYTGRQNAVAPNTPENLWSEVKARSVWHLDTMSNKASFDSGPDANTVRFDRVVARAESSPFGSGRAFDKKDSFGTLDTAYSSLFTGVLRHSFTVTAWLSARGQSYPVNGRCRNSSRALLGYEDQLLPTNEGMKLGCVDAQGHLVYLINSFEMKSVQRILHTGYRHSAFSFHNVNKRATLFVDGTYNDSAEVGALPVPYPSAFRLGAADQGTNEGFPGGVDEIRFYDRALSEQEVWAEYLGSIGELALPCHKPERFYLDTDGDGFGEAWNPLTTCAQPRNAVGNGGDCDDSDPTVSPAAADMCGDGVDSNCDGIGGPHDDEDGDGLSYLEELGYSDPCNADTDGDGVVDGEELYLDGDVRDTDGDGIIDVLDIDDDGDGIPTAEEYARGDTDGDSIPDYLDPDDDGDGIPTAEEYARGDTDGDGIPDYLDPDDDGDGIPTAEEGSGDADGDGIPNYLDRDSDGDGVPDALEGEGDADSDGIPDRYDTHYDGDLDAAPAGPEAYGFGCSSTGTGSLPGLAGLLSTLGLIRLRRQRAA